MILETLLALFLMQSPFTAAPDHYRLEFDNDWVQIVRVSYKPHEIAKMHDHPERPTVFVYTTDGGPLKFRHKEGPNLERPPVKAGGVRFTRGAAESHIVEYTGEQPSEYIRVELKTEPLDRPDRDIRMTPADRQPYENGQIRILHITCPPKAACPASAHPEDPAVVIVESQKAGAPASFFPTNSAPVANTAAAPQEQIRVELKSKPIATHRGQ